MWRCVGFMAAAMALCGLSARADYLYIRVDLSKAYQNVPAGMPAGVGGVGGIHLHQKPHPTGAGQLPGAGPFVSGIVEMRSRPKFEGTKGDDGLESSGTGGQLFDHPWGKNGRFVLSPSLTPSVIKYVKVVRELPPKQFERLFKKDIASKEPAKLLAASTWAFRRGLLTEFKSTMNEYSKVAPKAPLAINYQRVASALRKPPTADDPALKGLIADLTKADALKYRWVSDNSEFYAALTNLPSAVDAGIKRRVDRLQETLEYFYFWFALQENLPQPELPKYRQLLVIPNSTEEFNLKHAQWGSQPFTGDGLTTRRDNFILMSFRPLSETYKTFDRANQDLWKSVRYKKESLISGDVWDIPGATDNPFPVAFAQTLTIVQKAYEEEAEISTLSREGARQLLFASGILPRRVHVPEWIAQGLAAYFETAPGAFYRGVGSPSWSNLVSFNYFRAAKKFEQPSEVLTNVYTDRFYRAAEKDFVDLAELTTGSKQKINDRIFEEMDKANCTSWAFAYFMIERRKQPAVLFRYCQELNSLPRDLDLDERALEACFAKAFNVADAANPTKIDEKKLTTLADAWFAEMAGVSLDIPDMQNEYLEMRRHVGKKATHN